MIRPIIVLTRSVKGALVAAYVGEDAAAADKAFAGAYADETVAEVALYYYPSPRQVCEPAARAAILATSLASQRDPVKENEVAEAKAKASAIIEDGVRGHLESEALTEIRANAKAAAIGQVALEAVQNAIAQVALEALGNKFEAGGPTGPAPVPPVAFVPDSPAPPAVVPATATGADLPPAEDDGAESHFGTS